jgi:hypothetical protein
LTPTRGLVASVGMSNVLSDEKKQQVIALGRLGWTLRRIEQATGVRRETAGNYLKAAGIGVRSPGGWGHRGAAKADETTTDPGISKPAIEVITDSSPPKPANEATTDLGISKPAIKVITDSEPPRSRSVSACDPYREVIEQGLERGRNAMAIWQDLVSQYGFDRGYQSVKRFSNRIRPSQVLQAQPVIVTAPGEEAQVDYGTGPMVRDPVDPLIRELAQYRDLIHQRTKEQERNESD